MNLSLIQQMPSSTKVVSRLGLELRALALKAPTLMKNINQMNMRNGPIANKDLQ